MAFRTSTFFAGFGFGFVIFFVIGIIVFLLRP